MHMVLSIALSTLSEFLTGTFKLKGGRIHGQTRQFNDHYSLFDYPLFGTLIDTTLLISPLLSLQLCNRIDRANLG